MHRFSRTAAFATAVSFVGALVLSAPAQAQAVAPDWWYTQMGVAEVHAEGWTGEGITIAVIDTQINPDLEVFADANLTVDTNPLCPAITDPAVTAADEGAVHGSEVVALLVGNGRGPGAVQGIVPDANVIFYGVGDASKEFADGDVCGSSGDTVEGVEEGIIRALDAGADVISISLSVGLPIWAAQQASYSRAIAEGVVIVAASNNGTGFSPAPAPFAMNGVVGVNSMAEDGSLRHDADSDDPSKLNIHPEATVVAPGEKVRSADWLGGDGTTSGSSAATPLVAGVVAANMQKYPEATGNQIIQSLILNTWFEDHELERFMDDGFGYGAASLRHTLREDPTSLPDVNPLMDKALDMPSVEDVAEYVADVEQTPEATPEDTPTDDPGQGTPDPLAEAGNSFASTMLWVGIGAAVVGVAAVVVVLIVLTRSRARARKEGTRS